MVLALTAWAAEETIAWNLSYDKNLTSASKIVTTGVGGAEGTWTASPTTNVAAGYKGVALGKKDIAYKGTLTLSDSNIPANATINSVTLKCNGGKKGTSYKWNIKVNDVQASSQASMSCTLSPSSNDNLNAQEITVSDINLVGNEIVIDFANNTGAHIIYVWTITVKYTPGDAAPVEVEAFTTSPVAVDDEITVEKGTEVTFTAKNAAKIAYEITTAEITTGDVEGDTYTYTATEAAIVSVSAYDAEGAVKQTASYQINIKEAPLCGEIVFNPAAGEVAKGTAVEVSCENATRYEYTVEAADQSLSGAVEVNEGTFSYTVNEECTLHVFAYNADGKSVEASAKYTMAPAPLCGEVTFNPASGSEVYAGTEVTISCENAVSITYAVGRNNEVTVEGNTAKVTVDATCEIVAFGTNADGVDSESGRASYTVVERPAAETVDFDFTSADLAKLANKTIIASGSTKNEDANNLDDVTLTNGGVSMLFSQADASNVSRWFTNSSGTTELRTYKKSTITITAPAGCSLTKVVLTGDKVYYTVTTGTLSNGVWTPATAESTQNRAAANVTSLVLTNAANNNSVVSKISVTTQANAQTGVDSITVDDENVPVEYYNLQGIRVENPANGIFIRRCGTTVTKVAL